MSLDTPWQVEQTWGSNQPVLRGVLCALSPSVVIECGGGQFSTPLLREFAPWLITVEHDQAWVRRLRKAYPPDHHHSYVEHVIGSGVHNGTDPQTISPECRQSLDDFYRDFAPDVVSFSLVLVDTFRAARLPAIRQLASRSRVMIIHDVEPSSCEYYGWNALKDIFHGWFRYEHRPQGFINQKHIIPWTAVYSRFLIPLSPWIQEPIETESKRLWGFPVGLEQIDG